MNKTQLVAAIAAKADITKAEAAKYLNTVLGVVADTLSANEEIAVPDFGKFVIKHVPERNGINPTTKEKITIKAHDKIVFKPYENLRIYSRKHLPY